MISSTEKSLKFVHFGPYSFNPVNRELTRGDVAVDLRPKAGRFLQILVVANGSVVPHDELYAAIWKDRVVQRRDGLHQLAKDVRCALAGCDRNPVVNIPGVGYKFAYNVTPGYSIQEGKKLSTRTAYLGGLATLPAAFVAYCLMVAVGVFN